MGVTHRKPIVIIGGGVVGVCCAFYLQQAGLPVLLLEADQLGRGVSMGNLGLLAASHSMPLAAPGVLRQALGWVLRSDAPVKMSATFDLERARWLWTFFRSSQAGSFPVRARAMVALTQTSIALYRDFDATILNQSGFTHAGLLELFSSPAVFAKARRTLSLLRASGLDVVPLDASETRRFEPKCGSSVAGSLFFADDCHLQPYPFVMALAQQATEGGAAVREHAPVEKVESSGTNLKAVWVKGERIGVSSVVLAAGAATVSLAQQLGLRLPVQPGRGYTYDSSWSLGCRQRPLMLAEAHVVLVPMGDRTRIGGILDIGRQAQRVDPNRARLVTRRLSEYLKAPPECDDLPFWSGLRPCSADGLPIIGRSGVFDNLLFATGHGMLGVTHAPATALLIRDILLGKVVGDPWSEFAPPRLSRML